MSRDSNVDSQLDEKRRCDRQSWVRLESQVLMRRSLFKKEWIPVVPFDFSRYGMGIQTDEDFSSGEEVQLSLDFESESGEVCIPLLKGIVRYKEKHHSRFNYGVEFVYSSRSEKIQVESDLMSIERILKQYISETS